MMSDGVKFIFKTLIKVPIIIAIVLFLFNIFNFVMYYTRLYTLTQMVESIVMENNYIPADLRDTVVDYSASMSNRNRSFLRNIDIVDEEYNKDTGAVTSNRLWLSFANSNTVHYSTDYAKLQYGNSRRITVQGAFVWVIPLVTTKPGGLGAIQEGKTADSDAGWQSHNEGDYALVQASGAGKQGRQMAPKASLFDKAAGYETIPFRPNDDPNDIYRSPLTQVIRFRVVVPCMKYYSDIKG